MLVSIIEGDAADAGDLKAQLTANGFSIVTATTAQSAVELFSLRQIDAAVIATNLPDMDTTDLIASTRAARMWVPILVAMSASPAEDHVRALEMGADDFMLKPLAIPELIARLRALIRRASAPRWAPLSYANVTLDSEARHAIVAGRAVHLSPREYALLELLMRRREHVVARDEILSEVFGYQVNSGTNLIDVHVAHLRRKLERGEAWIETVRGVGFRLIATPDLSQ